jgi:hypothetical protein
MKLRLLTLLLLSFGVWSCESTQQAYVIVNETGTTPRLLYKDVQSNVGIAISGTYRLIGPSLRGDRVRLEAVQSLIQIEIENKGTKKIEFNPRKLQFISTNYLYVEFNEFIEKNKINVRVKQSRLEIPPGQGEKCYAAFVADFGDSSAVIPSDYLSQARLPKSEQVVLVWNDAVKYGGEKLNLPLVRFKPQE